MIFMPQNSMFLTYQDPNVINLSENAVGAALAAIPSWQERPSLQRSI